MSLMPSLACACFENLRPVSADIFSLSTLSNELLLSTDLLTSGLMFRFTGGIILFTELLFITIYGPPILQFLPSHLRLLFHLYQSHPHFRFPRSLRKHQFFHLSSPV